MLNRPITFLCLKNWGWDTLKEFFSGTKSRNCLQKECIESKQGHISNTEKLVVFDLQTLPLSAWTFAIEFFWLLEENSLLPWKKNENKMNPFPRLKKCELGSIYLFRSLPLMKYPTSFTKEIKSKEGDFCGQSAGSAEATKEKCR